MRYYRKLEEMLEELFAGRITDEQFREKMLEVLNRELMAGDEWLVRHFDSTAEYMVETLEAGEELELPFEKLMEYARREAYIFKDNGYGVPWMFVLMDEAQKLYEGK